MGNAIHLQGIGLHAAKPATEIKVGDVLVWNYGGTSTVKAILSETSKTVTIQEECRGNLYERRFSKTRLVADKALRPILP